MQIVASEPRLATLNKPRGDRVKSSTYVMAHRKFQHDKIVGIRQAWHGLSEVREEITLADNPLTEWDIVPQRQFHYDESGNLRPSLAHTWKEGEETSSHQWTRSVCTDNANIAIGAPYNPATYSPLSNAAFLSLIEECIGGTGRKITSCGSVRNRGRVFVSFGIEIPELKSNATGRQFSYYLNFGNGHDKSSVLWIVTGNHDAVCDNTFSALELFSREQKPANDGTQLEENDEKVAIRQRHTKNMKLRFPAIAGIVDKACGVQREFIRAMEAAGKEPLSEKGARELFAGFLTPKNTKEISSKTENRVERLTSLFSNGRGNKGESFADAFYAATEYFTHESAGGTDNPEKQFLSSEFGSGADRKRDFFSLLSGKPDEVVGTMKRGESLLAAC